MNSKQSGKLLIRGREQTSDDVGQQLQFDKYEKELIQLRNELKDRYMKRQEKARSAYCKRLWQSMASDTSAETTKKRRPFPIAKVEKVKEPKHAKSQMKDPQITWKAIKHHKNPQDCMNMKKGPPRAMKPDEMDMIPFCPHKAPENKLECRKKNKRNSGHHKKRNFHGRKEINKEVTVYQYTTKETRKYENTDTLQCDMASLHSTIKIKKVRHVTTKTTKTFD